MGKSTHFSGQPLYGQVIKLLDKSKIIQISRESGGERYTKRFDVWIHLVVMLYAVIMRFDSLRETAASLLAEARKLNHIGLTFKIGRSTLADANKRRPKHIFEEIYRQLYGRYRQVLSSDSQSRKMPKWMGRLQIIDSTTITLFSNPAYVTKKKKSLKYNISKDTAYQTPDGFMEVRVQSVVLTKKLKEV